MRARLATIGVAAVAGLTTLALATPAHAEVAEWTANQSSSIVDADTVRLEGTNTSVETANLGIEVAVGDEISFHYELGGGAQCTGGAPRVFIIVAGINTNSWDQLLPTGEQCGTDGVVTFTAGTAGMIGAAGAVYDNGGAGHVLVSDLNIAGEMVAFKAEPQPALSACESYETPSGGDLCGYEETEGDLDCGDIEAADRPVKVLDAGKVDPYGLDADGDGVGCEVEPSDEPSEEPSVAPSASTPPAAGGGLPITGASLTGFAIGGSLLVGAGAALVLWRRRVRFTA